MHWEHRCVLMASVPAGDERSSCHSSHLEVTLLVDADYGGGANDLYIIRYKTASGLERLMN